MVDSNVRRRLNPLDRKTEILIAADEVIKARGFGATAAEVARAAKASKATLFAYFPTFDALLEAVRARRLEKLKLTVGSMTSRRAIDFIGLFGHLARVLIEERLDMGLLHEVLYQGPFAKARPLPKAEQPATRFAAMVRAGQMAKACGADLDPDLTGRMIAVLIEDAGQAIAEGLDRTRVLTHLDQTLARLLSAAETGRA